MEHLTPEILETVEKGLKQLSTALRTLSKIPGLLKLSGTKKSGETSLGTKTSPDFFFNGTAPKPKEFLLSRHCKWGVGLPQEVLTFLLGANLRANRFHDQWVYREGWHTISESEYTKIWEFVDTFYQECKLLLTEHYTLKAFQKNVGAIRGSKWNRRDKMLDSELEHSKFVQYAREAHKTLCPLK